MHEYTQDPGVHGQGKPEETEILDNRRHAYAKAFGVAIVLPPCSVLLDVAVRVGAICTVAIRDMLIRHRPKDFNVGVVSWWRIPRELTPWRVDALVLARRLGTVDEESDNRY